MSTQPELDFLVTELGFEGPRDYFVGHDHVSRWQRDDIVVSITWDGATTPIGHIRCGDRQVTTCRLSPAAIAAAIREHPGILRGEFDALEAADAEELRRDRYARDPRAAEVEQAFRQEYAGQPGVVDVICGLDPIREVKRGIFVKIGRGYPPVRLPRNFRGFEVRRLYLDREGRWQFASLKR